jgi:hypothetical protein
MDDRLAAAGTGAGLAGGLYMGYRLGTGKASRGLRSAAGSLEKSGRMYQRGSTALGGLGKGLYGLSAGLAATAAYQHYGQGDTVGTAGYGALSGGALAAGFAVRSKGKFLGRASRGMFGAAGDLRATAATVDSITAGGAPALVAGSKELAIEGARRRS